MDRLMERKLALLEAEYNECINAESRAQQTTAEEAAMHGYGRVGVGAGAGGGGDRDGQYELQDEEEEENEFSPAWTRFKADMDEERRRQQAEGLESDDGKEGPEGQEAAEESKQREERRIHAPLTSDKISSIKSVMSGIRLRPPPWAVGMAEEVWMARILERAGLVRRAAAVAANTQQQQQQQRQVEEERRRRKDKKKARRVRRAQEARQLQDTVAASSADSASTADDTHSPSPPQSHLPTQQGESGDGGKLNAAASFNEDFETAFPAMSPPPPSTAAAGSSGNQSA